MYKFKFFSLIFLIVLTNQEVLSAFKCDFEVIRDSFNNFYTCTLSGYLFEHHLQGSNDNDVTKVSFSSYHYHMSESDYPICRRFPNLNKIRITGIKSVDGNLLQDCRNLLEIEIVNTSIWELPENFFGNNSYLSIIDLRDNKLTTLPEGIFSNSKGLWSILLDNNRIEDLPSNIFKSLTVLDKLSLKNNNIELLSSTLFEDLVELDDLFLNNNKITELPKDVFKNLKNLETLRISNNKLTTIHSDSFGTIKGLELIDLKDNQISSIDEKIFDKLPIVMLRLENNVCADNVLEQFDEDLRNCYKYYEPRE
ncbi:hypothetical protein ACKWTF_004602 [Chironomus riparius]